ncbi:unnamed protein product, partial [Mesorhabditis spiculigera]
MLSFLKSSSRVEKGRKSSSDSKLGDSNRSRSSDGQEDKYIELQAVHDAPEPDPKYCYLEFKKGDRLKDEDLKHHALHLVHPYGTDGYAVELRFDRKSPIVTYPICRNKSGYYLQAKPKWYRPTVIELVELYQKNPILKTRLRNVYKEKPITYGQWEVPRRELLLGAVVSNGARSIMRKANWYMLPVAVKSRKLTKSGQRSNLSKKWARLIELQHPNIIRLLGVCLDVTPELMVLEWMSGGTLDQFLKKRATPLGIEGAIDTLAQIAAGMEYLSKAGKVHGDLAARNVLVDLSGEDMFVKITGMARVRDIPKDSYCPASGRIAFAWSAPEVLNSMQFTNRSDSWSFAVLIFELFSMAEAPYEKELGKDKSQAPALLLWIYQGNRLRRLEQYTDFLYQEIVEPCFEYNWRKRPTFKKILELLRDPPPTPPQRLSPGTPLIRPRSLFGEDRWEIKNDELVIGDLIGSGNYGDVLTGEWRGIIVAVKIVRPDATRKVNDEFKKEVQQLKEMTHPNIVRLYGVVTTEIPNKIVTEFMSGGSLLHYLQKTEANILQSQALHILTQVATGMEYLTDRGKIHRDLAARNVLIDSDRLVVKVADFGLTRDMPIGDYYQLVAGGAFPIAWSAPEVLVEKKFAATSDSWSFGVLIFELYTHGLMPYFDQFRGKEVTTTTLSIWLNQGNRLRKPALCPDIIYQKISLPCFEYEWRKRPHFTQILEVLQDLRFDPAYPSDDECIYSMVAEFKQLVG